MSGPFFRDFRTRICRFEEDLFASFPAGHQLLPEVEAQRLIGEVFACHRAWPPILELVPGFDDPRIAGFADVARHRIAIEHGYLYRFLVLHESAHLLAPKDRRHGPDFTFVLQRLYRRFVGIPEEVVRTFLLRHELPIAA
ncbi:MAG TPA: hypothetical protein VKT70_03190 [Stellaceae bacterium]|nr:hypothetical protein [Stellaceae bacterium]